MKKDIFIPNEIQDIIDSMTSSISISDISEAGGVSTITTDSIRIFDNLCKTMDLKNGMIVTMDSVNYVVSNVTHTPLANTFQVTGTNLTASEWNVAINYKPGSRAEIIQILNKDSGSLDRFPLMWLISPEEQELNSPVIDFTSDLDIVFAHKANNTDFTTTRYNNNIEPVIQPLITLFNYWLQSSDFNYMLEFNGHNKPIEYTKNIFTFFGNSDKTKNVLNITTDAIEVNYSLKFKKQY